MCALRSWETGSWGRRSGIWSPAEPLSQCKKASVNQLLFTEPESGEQKWGESKEPEMSCPAPPTAEEETEGLRGCLSPPQAG